MLGNIYDSLIWLKTMDYHPPLPREYFLGDCHYMVLPWFITPYPQPPEGK